MDKVLYFDFNKFIALVKLPDKKEMEEYMPYLTENWKDFQSDLSDMLEDYEQGSTHGMRDMAIAWCKDGGFPSPRWQGYYSSDYREEMYVRNVKGKGLYPDEAIAAITEKHFDDVEEIGIDVRQWLSEEWSFEVGEFYNQEDEYLQEKYGKHLVVAGRSEGYWGFKVGDLTFKLNVAELAKTFSAFLQQELDGLKQSGEILDDEDGFEYIIENFSYMLDKGEMPNLVELSEEDEKMLNEFDYNMSEQIKELEDVAFWVTKFDDALFNGEF